MADEFASTTDTQDSAARNAAPVVPHAVDPLPNVSKALYIGVTGNLTVRLVDDDTDVTFGSVPAGMILPVRATHVRDTSTAGAIVNLY